MVWQNINDSKKLVVRGDCIFLECILYIHYLHVLNKYLCSCFVSIVFKIQFSMFLIFKKSYFNMFLLCLKCNYSIMQICISLCYEYIFIVCVTNYAISWWISHKLNLNSHKWILISQIWNSISCAWILFHIF